MYIDGKQFRCSVFTFVQYNSKCGVILKIVSGSVGIKECSLDLIFYKRQLDHLVYFWGKGCLFSIDETRCFRQSESIYFCNQRKYFYNCYKLYT